MHVASPGGSIVETNGKAVGDGAGVSPWMDFSKAVYYQSYDLMASLTSSMHCCCFERTHAHARTRTQICAPHAHMRLPTTHAIDREQTHRHTTTQHPHPHTPILNENSLPRAHICYGVPGATAHIDLVSRTQTTCTNVGNATTKQVVQLMIGNGFWTSPHVTKR